MPVSWYWIITKSSKQRPLIDPFMKGIDFRRKLLQVGHRRYVKLQIWDTAGMSNFDNGDTSSFRSGIPPVCQTWIPAIRQASDLGYRRYVKLGYRTCSYVKHQILVRLAAMRQAQIWSGIPPLHKTFNLGYHLYVRQASDLGPDNRQDKISDTAGMSKIKSWIFLFYFIILF